MKTAALIAGALLASFGVQAAQAEELTRDEAMKIAMRFVGTWQGTTPAGNTGEFTVKALGGGSAVIFEGGDFVRILGWNPAKKCLEWTSYYAAGGRNHAECKVLDDKPTLQMRAYNFDEEGKGTPFNATITFLSDDSWELKIGDDVWTQQRKSK